MTTLRCLPLLLIAALLSCPTAHADLLLTVSNASIAPGGMATVDVFIEGDGIGVTEDIQEFTLFLELSPINGTGDSSLIFVDPQTETHLDAPNVANYVFVGSSEALSDTTLDTATVDSDTEMNYFDSSLDAMDDPLNVAISAPRLIASVDLSHLLGTTASSATLDDEYTLSVSQDSTFFEMDAVDSTLFTGVEGTLTIQAVAIPEPGVAAVLFLFGGGALMRRRKRHR